MDCVNGSQENETKKSDVYFGEWGGGGVVDHSVEGIRILAKRSAQELIQNMTTKMGNYVDEEEERV